jgi:hypothetical protein
VRNFLSKFPKSLNTKIFNIMNIKKQLVLLIALIAWVGLAIAMPPYKISPKAAGDVTQRAGCARPSQKRDLEVNNVRARLWNGGDMWWDHATGQAAYYVPKAGINGRLVSSLFAGGIWVGGFDAAGASYIAATTYGNGNTTGGDWYAGPLTPGVGNITAPTCKNWDRMFEAKGSDIELVKTAYYGNGITNLASSTDPALVAALENLKKWPGRGNPYFAAINGFAVPSQEMAPFFDQNNDGKYDPLAGDFPKINVIGCEDNNQYQKAQYGDQMFWWVYNDVGGPHLETGLGPVLRMEVQVQSFAYASDDALNNMTFYRYKLLNRASFELTQTFMSLWSDPDMGCSVDDYIGCINDTTRVTPISKWDSVSHTSHVVGTNTVTRSLGFVYNADTDDNQNCPGGGVGYGTEIPILGVDYFRGPREKTTINSQWGDTTFLKELGMTSFSYYSRQGTPAQTSDPTQQSHYFNYMRGFWKNGKGYYPCGDGTVPCAPDFDTLKTTKFVFPGHPNRANEWSMASANLPPNDYRFLHTTGPFKMLPGATNEIISGVPWVPNQAYGPPSLNQILSADDLAQSIFDNCFDILDGPDAPELTLIENDKSLILTLLPVGNNVTSTLVADGSQTVIRKTGEAYEELSPAVPSSETNRKYKFEGYRVYQLKSDEVDFNKDREDPTKVREILNVDIKNNVKTIINWESSPLAPGVFIPVEKVRGKDTGIKHSFKVTRDQFASDAAGSLINHKKYYFKTVSYAYNNYKDFKPFDPNNADRGQKTPYITGRRGVDRTYIGIPRRNAAEALGTEARAAYGDIPPIIRADGKGNDGLFLDLEKYTITNASNNIIQEGRTTGELGYKRGFGPVEVKVVDPLGVAGGEFLLTLSRDSTGRNTIAPTPAKPIVNVAKTYWELKQTTGSTTRRWVSERNLELNTDQYIPDLGISIRVAQPLTASEDVGGNNGFIGAELVYSDTTKSWFAGIRNKDQNYGGSLALDIIKTDAGQLDKALDPNKVYNNVLNGWIMPYPLCDCSPANGILATPVWQTPSPGQFCAGSSNAVRSITNLNNLNNVDIVFTPDTSKWSRCIVIETTPDAYRVGDTVRLPQRNYPFGALRPRLSVNKLGQPDGSGTYGFGWFPGYAVDVETGTRLNIYFGESSLYDGREPGNDPGQPGGTVNTGGDMLFNPSTDWLHGNGQFPANSFQAAFGGFHNIYVSRDAYDGCKVLGGSTVLGPAIATALPPSNVAPAKKVKAFNRIAWTSMVLPTVPMLPIAKGLIPTETTIKLRVNSQYASAEGTNSNQTMPQYRFNLDKFVPKAATEDEVASILKEVRVVPNPYYSYSDYENNENDNRIQIQNLPPECVVTVYSLDGRFIRQFKRNEDRVQPNTRSITPSVEWDLTNAKGIPVSSGTYLIHIDAPGIGQRVIKWFGVTRALDASKL